jgi:nucleoside-diphosphate-sugar epimerase
MFAFGTRPSHKLTPLASTEVAERRRAAVSGASGYLGGRVAAALIAKGWEVIGLGRRPSALPGVGHRPFQLDERFSPDLLDGVDALVHCAWDFGQRSWDDVVRVNVCGSRRLFEAGVEAGVGRLVHVSTVSAAGSPRSMYGRAKLRTEDVAAELGGIVVRPGLLYGPGAGGMVGTLTNLVRALPVVPVPVGDDRPLYLAHQDDVTRLVARIAGGLEGTPGKPLVAAAPDPHTLRELLGAIASSEGHRRLFFRVPWQLAYFPLRAMELARAPVPVRADSALSIATLDPDPFRTGARPDSVEFRRLELGDASDGASACG